MRTDRRTLLTSVGAATAAVLAGCSRAGDSSGWRPDPDRFPSVDVDERAALLAEQFDVRHVREHDAEMREVGFALDVIERIVDDPGTLAADAFSADGLSVDDLDAVGDVATELPEGREGRATLLRGDFDAEGTVSAIADGMDDEPVERDSPADRLLESSDGAVGRDGDAVVYGHDPAVVGSMLAAPTDESERYFGPDAHPAALTDGLAEFSGVAAFESADEERIRVDGYDVIDPGLVSVTARFRFVDPDRFETEATEREEATEGNDDLRNVETTRLDDEQVLVIDAELEVDLNGDG